MWRGWRSSSWQTAQGVIVCGRTDRGSQKAGTVDSDGYVVATSGHHIVFRFEADNETHFSNSRRFGQLAASDPSSAGEVARLYPLGPEVTVFYDPADPDLARYGPPALERRSFC